MFLLRRIRTMEKIILVERTGGGDLCSNADPFDRFTGVFNNSSEGLMYSCFYITNGKYQNCSYKCSSCCMYLEKRARLWWGACLLCFSLPQVPALPGS